MLNKKIRTSFLIVLLLGVGLFFIIRADFKYSPQKKNAGIEVQKNITEDKIQILPVETAKEEIEKIKLLYLGDIMLDRHVGEKIKQKGLGYLFVKLVNKENDFFKGYNLVSANLEGAVTNKGAHYSPVYANDFAFSPEIVKDLKNYNFSFFNIANNHLMDQGERGVTGTENNLNNLDFKFSGCPDGKAGECSAAIVDTDKYKIGLAGFSMVYKNFDIEEAKKQVENLKKQTDLVVVSIHWGEEYKHNFNKKQQETAYSLVDAGADIIIGHHPHVVQGIEVYNSKPIFYSLGNFIFDQYFSRDTQEELAVEINYDSSGLRAVLYPLESKSSQPELMQGDEKKNFLEKLVEWSKVEESYKIQIREGKVNI